MSNTTANSVACERAFSAWNLQHTKQRNSLSSERVNALVFIHMNCRSLLGSSNKPASGAEFDDEFEWQALKDETKAMERLTRLMSQLSVDYEEGEDINYSKFSFKLHLVFD